MTPEELAEKAVPCQPHSGRVMTFAHVVRQEVATTIRAAVAEERERCARKALSALPGGLSDHDRGLCEAQAFMCAVAIRQES